MDIYSNLQYLLLAVLFLPLAAAVVVAVAGRAGTAVARRTAAWLAAAHLILTVGLTFLAGSALVVRSGPGYSNTPGSEPMAVAGAEGADDPRTAARGTTWALLSLGPPPAYQVPASDVQFFIGLDGLNLALVFLASLMTFLAVLVSWESVTERAGGYYAWVFALQTGVTGAFVAFDIVLFYVFFELTLVPAFFLIGRWGVGGGKRDAARKFFLYTLLGGLITLVGIVGVVVTNPTPVNPFAADPAAAAPIPNPMVGDPRAPGEWRPPARGPVTFSIPRLVSNHRVWAMAATLWVARMEEKANRPGLSPVQKAAADRALAEARAEKRQYHALQGWLFLALMAGFAVKMPLVPFHTWLPAAYAEAPLAVTMLLSGLLAKLGTFGILRLVLPLTPEAAVEYGLPGVGVLAAIGIVYAGLCAYAQRDLKLLVAYSSVSHLGFLALGLFSLTPEGLTGAVLHMVNHGLTVAALFALLGFLADRYRTLDADQYSGLWARFPRYTFFVVLVCLAAVGLPGLNNFVSEMAMLAGLFDPRNLKTAGYGFGVAAVAGIFLSAWYTLTMLRRVFFGPLREPAAATGPLPPTGLTAREGVTYGVLGACCVVLGLFPQPAIDVILPDAARISSVGDVARYTIDPANAFRHEPEAFTPVEDSPPPGPPGMRGPGGPGGPPGPGGPGGGPGRPPGAGGRVQAPPPVR